MAGDRRLRVLMLVLRNPERSPGQRYRLEQYLPYFAANGVDVTYSWVMDDDDASDFYGQRGLRAKARVALKTSARRLASLRHLVPRPDVALVYREAFFLGGAWSEWLASLRAPIVYDFDDAIWMHAISDANRRFAFLKNVSKIRRIVSMSNTVVAGNTYLATWARAHSDNVTVVPTVVDTDVFCPPEHRPVRDDHVVIGWCGSPSTVAHLEPILPALEQVAARFGDRVRFRVMGDPNFHHPALGLDGEAWSPTAELEILRDLDVGLMPLPDDEWSKGKCGLKALTAMASGAATVVSPVGVNTEIVQDGINGLCASSMAEWVHALSRLVEDPSMRQRLAAAGRRTVVEDYSVRRWAPRVVEVLRDAANR